MKIRCPQCSSLIESANNVADSTQCPACGQELRLSSSLHGPIRRALATADVLVPTMTFQKAAANEGVEEVATPRTLGRYRLSNELGAGAFGRVFRAFDTDLQREVAIKILKEDRVVTKDLNDQFFREAQLMASIHHAGIVAVYDVGEENGTRYIVTQFLDSGTLHDRLQREPLSRVDAADITRQCAEAIHSAHKSQLYHRDLKPKNILMDSRGLAYVGDFGLAIRRCDQDQLAGEFAGSLNFMSPEQLRGEAHRLDGRTDVWALGVTLYLMLTGQLPFQGQGKRVINEILDRDPLPPRQLDETIPPELERICLKCLEKSVTSRYQSAFDLASQLRDWVASNQSQSLVALPALAGQFLPISTAEQASCPTVLYPPQRRSRLPLSAFAVTILVLIAAAGWLGPGLLTALGFAFPVENKGNPIAQAVQPPDPFEIDTYAVRGRPYSVLERPPKETVWPSAASTPDRYLFDEKRQELATDSREYGLLGLATTGSQSFRLRVSINKNNWDGSTGLFWGYQLAPTKAGVMYPQCHALRLTGGVDDTGKQVLRMALYRLVFKESPHLSTPAIDQSQIAMTEVLTKGVSPYEVSITIRRNGLRSVIWCGDEMPTLREPAISPHHSPLSNEGIMGVCVFSTSAGFSDARVTLFE